MSSRCRIPRSLKYPYVAQNCQTFPAARVRGAGTAPRAVNGLLQSPSSPCLIARECLQVFPEVDTEYVDSEYVHQFRDYSTEVEEPDPTVAVTKRGMSYVRALKLQTRQMRHELRPSAETAEQQAQPSSFLQFGGRLFTNLGEKGWNEGRLVSRSAILDECVVSLLALKNGKAEHLSPNGSGPPWRLSALSIFLCQSVLYGAFIWARKALNIQTRRVPARAVCQPEHQSNARHRFPKLSATVRRYFARRV